jgi:hypothetical protein
MKPCQRNDAPNFIPDAVHAAAYDVYEEVYGSQPALMEGNCRQGFGVGELIAFLYARAFPRAEWQKRVHDAMYRDDLGVRAQRTASES